MIRLKFKNNLILFWLLIFISIKINGQNYFEDYQKLKINTTQIDLKNVSDSLINRSIKQKDFKSAIHIANAYAKQRYRNKNYDVAIRYAEKAIRFYKEASIKDENFTNTLFNLGVFNLKNLDYNKAIAYYKEVITINNSPKKKAQAYCGIGSCFKNKEDFFTSISYFEKGIRLLEKQQEHKNLFNQYLNLAKVYRGTETKENLIKELDILEKAKRVSKYFKLSPSKALRLNVGFANHYNSILLFNFEKARGYYKESLKIGFKIRDSSTIATIYNNISNIYIREKHDSAVFFLKKGFLYASTNIEEVLVYNNFTQLYLKNKNFESALKSTQNALNLLLNSDSNWQSVPSILKIENNAFKQYILHCLNMKIEILTKLYLNNKDENYIINAMENSRVADALIAVIQKSSAEEKTKYFWRKEAAEIYVKAVYAAFLKKDSKAVFYFMEKNKAILLTESIYRNTERKVLPKNIIDKENKIKKRVYQLENSIIRIKEEEQQKNYKDSLFNTKIVLQQYTDSVKLIYPKYFKEELSIKPVDVLTVQKELKEDAMVISFIWNKIDASEEVLLGMLISKNKIMPFKVDAISNLREQIKRYKGLIATPFETKKNLNDFQEVSYQLYKQLFPDAIIKQLALSKELVIVPDGILQSMPFEALITKANSNNYLLKKMVISYANSMSFLRFNKRLKRIATTNFIGYSPVNYSYENLIPLKYSEREIASIKKNIGGEIITDKVATKQHFLAHSKTSKVIHLATHADANQNPWIAFSDKKLSLSELYTYKNNASLVVLSGCNTSLGNVVSGEGVLSLARGFFYSGANSVVSSLWNVSDNATATIMSSFYKNIKEGKTKANALQGAKLNYLNTHSLSELSPYYWSSFILIGDPGVVKFTNNNSIMYFLIGIGLLLLTLIYTYKK